MNTRLACSLSLSLLFACSGHSGSPSVSGGASPSAAGSPVGGVGNGSGGSATLGAGGSGAAGASAFGGGGSGAAGALGGGGSSVAGASALGGGGSAAAAGGAGAAGTSGAGGVAAGGASSCVTSGTELCEGFESGTLDQQKWQLNKPTASASISVDGTRPHTGQYSLHIQLNAGDSSTAQIVDAITFPAQSNTFYTRAYFYFSPDLPSDDNGGFHMAFLLATGNNDLGFVEAGLGSAGQKQYLGYSEYYGAGPDNHEHGPTFTEFGPRSQLQVAPQQWLCLELMQGGDETTTHRRVWIDGSELTEQKNDYSERKPPEFSRLSIGVLQYHPTPILTDVWVDDIRVSSARIGCDD